MQKLLRRFRTAFLVLLLGVLGAVSLFSVCSGAVKLSAGDVVGVVRTQFLGENREPTDLMETSRAILWDLRVPRVLFGIFVGATLSVTGTLMQGLFRNPLADPGLVGVSSGAALGAVMVLILAGHLFPATSWMSDVRFLPVAAFVGAFGVTLVIVRVAYTGGYTAVATLLLSGVAMNSIVGASIGLSTFLATDAQLRSLSFWTLGSLGSADWEILGIMSPVTVVVLLISPWFSKALNAMALGEAEAEHLGFSVERIKHCIILVTAIGVGVCVAFSGMIGFIGLVVPHLMRLCIGPDHRWLVPGSAIGGAILLVSADTVARTAVAPAEMPIGILTAALGGPFFLAMLLSQRRRSLWG